LKTKPNFSLTEKYFSLTNFSNDKQIQKNSFQKPLFNKHNTNTYLPLIVLLVVKLFAKEKKIN